MSKSKQKKIDTVFSLAERLKKSHSLVLTDYQGLTHRQLEELRKLLAKVQGDFMVVKNTLLMKALKTSDFRFPTSDFPINGPTALLVAHRDELSPLQKLAQFIKESGLPKIKLGFFFNQVLKAEEVNKLSLLPPRNILLLQLVSSLKSPLCTFYLALSWNLQRFISTLEAIKAKKSGGDIDGK